MKILVLSDSHSAMRFMRSCVEKIKPQAIVHLGDHYDDGETLKELYPHIELHQVPGNCDRYRCPPWVHARLCYDVCGVRLFMTHGHKYGVKTSTAMMLAEARAMGAQAALYGHTHVAEVYREEEGMWVLNPGVPATEAAAPASSKQKTTTSSPAGSSPGRIWRNLYDFNH